MRDTTGPRAEYISNHVTSGMDLGRLKTPSAEVDEGQDRFSLRLGPDDVHDPCQIIDPDRDSDLGGYFWKRLGEEVCRPHAGCQ